MRHRPSRAHQSLGPDFYDEVEPAQFPQYILRYRNQPWATRVGLENLTDEAWINHFGKFHPIPGSLQTPLALRYHGHQFRTYNPDLGDGRGFLFAQLHDLHDHRLLDLGTKGSGTTPWSRTADGRLTLKGGIREVLATAMLEAQGVYTSKSFSLIETGEELIRGDEPSPTRSAVLVRLSHTHIRIGTFQRYAYEQNTAALSRLLGHSTEVAIHEAARNTEEERAPAFLQAVCQRVARMGAQWMAAGFVHGVLNTDNINITGESFDYGPWRFLPTYDPAFTAAYFDHQGLYAFGRQPDTLLWNLTRLAECLLPLAPQPELEQALATFVPEFRQALAQATLRRLNLSSKTPEEDGQLSQSLWTFLHASQAPFEQTFFDWHGGTRRAPSPNDPFYTGDPFTTWQTRLAQYHPTQTTHPYFTHPIPCTLLTPEVESLWTPIATADDWTRFQTKLHQITQMADAYATLPATAPP